MRGAHGASHASPRICQLKEALVFALATLKLEIFDQKTIVVR
jgi:hypothetical protein